jgi:hypothetical protein
MQTKRIHYIFAAIAFLVALFTYTATMQPSIPFWDCGEFAAAAISLSIPHPPGAPLQTIVGRIMMLLPIFSDPAARFNFLSVLSSAVSVMFLYLIIVRLIKMWRGAPQSMADVITMYGGALVGALSFVFTDSFWFNALECEVYAFGSLFIAVIPWLILVWYDHADDVHSEKWLLLIFYVIGLSMGVHQLALLTIFPVFMLVYYKRWSSEPFSLWGRSFSKWGIMAIFATVAFGIAFFIVLSQTVTWLGGGVEVVENGIITQHKSAIWTIGGLALLLIMPIGIYFTGRNAEHTGKDESPVGMLFTGLLVLLGLFGVYALFAGATGSKSSSATVGILMCLAVWGIWYARDKHRVLLHLGLWASALLFLGFTTYSSIMVRASQNPPMNQHHPSTFTRPAGGGHDGIHEYIDREQYGEASELPRRDPRQKEDAIHAPTWDETKYSSDMDFFLKYQTDHMYLRYWFWNFVGRANDNQDAPTDWTKTAGIPLIIGLFGMFWHFRRDPKRAFSVLAMFVMMGLVTAWYQNQQDAQPRERDYFYVGAFYAYAIWVGIGATGILEFLRSRFAKKQDLPMQAGGPLDREVPERDGETIPALRGEGPVGMLAATFALLVILVPLNQCIGLVGQFVFGQSWKQASKWAEYSRKHNNFPLEYAYNILQSCEPDAILFTAGDNDTFPLWCIQDVYGVRRDVRIVNLSLGNMGWYVKQLKDEHPWGAKTIKLPSFTEDQLAHQDETPQGIRSYPDDPTMVTVNVSAEAMGRFTGVAQPGSFAWKWVGQRKYSETQYIYQVADQLIKDIVVNNINDRPIYFAAEVSPSYWDGLDGHVVFEGMSARVVPGEHPAAHGLLDGDIDELKYTQAAYRIPPKIETQPSRGMICNSFRDPEANRSSLDEHYGTSTYLQLYGRLANYLLNQGRQQEAHRALDTLDARLPPNLVSWDYNLLQAIGQLYHASGDDKMSKKYTILAAQKLSSTAEETPSGDQNQYFQNQFAKADLYMGAEWYDSARMIYSALRPQLEGGNQQFIDFRLGQIDAKVLEKKGDKKGSLSKLNELLVKYQSLGKMGAQRELDAVVQERDRLGKELGMLDSIKSSPAPQLPTLPDASKVAGSDTAGSTPSNKK